MEKIIVTIPELQAYGAIVSPAFSGPGQANFGIVFLRLKDERKRSVQEIVNGPGGLKGRFFAEVEGAIAVAQIPKAISRSFGSPFQLVLKAQNLDELNKYTEQLLNKLRPSGYLQNARSSFEYSKPELRLNIDRDRAASLGVSIQEISRTLQMLFGGLDLSRIKLDGKEYKVITQLERTSRQTPQDVDKLYVRNNKGELIQLSSIVSYQTGPSPNAIEHYNRIRSTTISASIVGVPIGTAVARVEELLKNDLPAGFTYEFAGESRDLKESGTEVWWVMIIALIIVYMVLAAQFESLIHPLTVMLAIPLAGLGAYGSLWLISFINKLGIFPEVPAMNDNLFSKIGIILLVGLVTKNSILLVEFANQQLEKGASAFDAMMQAGTVRLRPILMTAFSTIAGILPIAIGFGAGAESRRPMGVAVVGGMVTSTFLTLLVIPVVYTVFSDLAERFSRKAKVANSGHEPSEVLAK